MSKDEPFQLSDAKKDEQQENLILLRKIYYQIISRWYYIIIALVLTLICAFVYNTLKIPTYRISSTLLIDEENKGASMGNDQLFEGFGLGAGIKNLDNQIMVLSSKMLIGRALDELNYNIEYYRRGPFNKIALYPNTNITVIPENADSLPRDIEFKIRHLNNNHFTIDSKSKDTFNLRKESYFGEYIISPSGRFAIERINDSWPEEKKYRTIYFINYDRDKLIESYSKRMKVEPASKKGTIVKISLEGTNKTMDVDFLNKLIEIFLNNSLEKKNEEAIRTIQFIDDQLIGISDSLSITENKLQQFRSQNRVMNLSAQGQVIIDQAMSLENQKARLGIEANYYNYLADYLAKDNIGQAPIAPATMGITDPGLTKLVTDLADIQGQYYNKSLGEKNPMQSQLAQRLRNTKEALRETLNGVRRSNNMAMNEIAEQIKTVNAQASALPVTERQLLGIERKYKLNDELYTFLLEKRAGAQIQKASNMPDNEVIDPPKAEALPIEPRKPLIYFFALMLGIGIPLLWIFIADIFNNKVRQEEDIMKIVDIPIIGHISHSNTKNNTIVFEEPDSNVTEDFRSLRSRIKFITKGNRTPVILITSAMSEEGKTFTAINLAAAYSLIGKKTVLVGFDLRKPNTDSAFNLPNNGGVSTWLNGHDELQNVLKETPHKDLFIIPAGPVQPNPGELIASEKTSELIDKLKANFECIIIDTSPLGTVSDTSHLVSLADTCLLVVKQNKTLKNALQNTIKELKFSDIKNINIVINGN